MRAKRFSRFVCSFYLFLFAFSVAFSQQPQKPAAMSGGTNPTPSSGVSSKKCVQPHQDAWNGLTIDFYCPVELVLTDPLGRRTGFNPTTSTYYTDDPNAGYNQGDEFDDDEPPNNAAKLIQTFAAVDGDYSLSVFGTSPGKYSARIYARYNYFGHKKVQLANLSKITISKGDIHAYAIHYENKAGVAATLSGGFDGGGQRPKDVNKFLTYANPSDSQTDLPAGTTTFPLMIFYGNNVITSTFKASLNGVDITNLFSPTAGNHETVNLSLSPGRNVLSLSTDGNLPSRIATDTDRLVFIVK